jgi:anti-anti-sigma regulatory factor
LEKTRQQTSTLSVLLDHLTVGVVFLEAPSGNLVLTNPASRRLMKRAALKDEPGGSPPSILYPDTDRHVPFDDLPAQVALRTGTMHACELDILAAESGARTSVEATAVPVRDESGEIKNVLLMWSDITSRKASERERALLQDEVIRAQNAMLVELSSPLIPITDDILVLPLIGSLSTARGHQVMDALLSGTSRKGARVAILDITGVQMLDTQAALLLTNAARALRLLGVEPVLTGIQPDVAPLSP